MSSNHNSKNLSLSPLDSFLKRAIDISLSIILIFLTSPLFIIFFLLIKLTSKGSAIYKQERVGLNGQIFTMYKFRSMEIHDESVYVQTKKNDPRVTFIGNIIRRLSIDELPQLINVLIGNMSLVGPRPAPIVLHEKYKLNFVDFPERLNVKPGITGLAQIKGCRGGDDLDHIRKRLDYDIEYISNWSLYSEIKIILLTPISLLIGKDIY